MQGQNTAGSLAANPHVGTVSTHPVAAQTVQAAADRVLRASAAVTCQEAAFDWAELVASLRRGLEAVLSDVAESVQVRLML